MGEWVAARRGKSWLIGMSGGPAQLVVSPPPGFPGAGDDWFDKRTVEMMTGLNDAQRDQEGSHD